METTLLLWIFAIVLVVVGLASLVIPAMPGTLMLFGGLLLAAWADDFMYVGTGTLIILGVLTLLIYVADFAATAFGAKRFGASYRAMLVVLWGTPSLRAKGNPSPCVSRRGRPSENRS